MAESTNSRRERASKSAISPEKLLCTFVPWTRDRIGCSGPACDLDERNTPVTERGQSISAATLTPMAIRNFAPPTALAGYDRKTVDSFLKELATRYEQAVEESASLRRQVQALEESLSDARPVSSDGDLAARASALEEELASLRRREQAIGAALLVAEEAAAGIRSEAERNVEAIRTTADEHAKNVRAKAQEEADKLVSDARELAERIERDAMAKRLTYEQELERIRTLHETTREDLATFLLEALHRLREPGEDHTGTDQLVTERGPHAAESRRD
jgi:cell division septum initiation protein DivIVA